ncbi:MAG: hypothetical protein ACI306_01860 [Muribaculaceae bacterium]
MPAAPGEALRWHRQAALPHRDNGAYRMAIKKSAALRSEADFHEISLT